VNRPGRGPNWAPADDVSLGDEHAAVHQGSRKARFIRLALALDDLLAASACLKLTSQPDATLTLQARRALVDAMVVAYGRLFFRSDDETCGLPGRYAPEGRLLATHLQLLGLRNLSRRHGESSSRRVLVGPAHGRSTESHAAPGGCIVWSVRSDPLGPLGLQQVDALFQHLRARVLADAGQLCADLFVGRAAPVRETAMEDA
jgi:hypothetical protein